VELLTQELANEKERAQFLFLLKQHEPKIGTGTGTQTGKGGTAVGTAFGSIRRSETENGSATIRPEALAGIANQVLVKYLGPISKIVTKRAASKARTSEQFMQLVSQDLPDDAQRSAFNKDMQAAIVAHTTATGGNG
jgi:hypothetical protein